MIETIQVGKLFFSLNNNPVADEGCLGIMVRKDHNGFVMQNSIIVVWDNDKFSEYLERDLGQELELTNSSTDFVRNIDYSCDKKITECIKSGFFKKLFIQLKTGTNITRLESE